MDTKNRIHEEMSLIDSTRMPDKKISRKELDKKKLFHQIYGKMCAQQNKIGIETPQEFEFNTYFKEIGIFGTNIEQQKNLKNEFPLYGANSNAISFWSIALASDKSNFKKYQPLTKPNSARFNEQWS